MQVAWDVTAFLASATAGIFTLTRRRMLSGDHARWCSASGLVQAALALQAIFFAGVALSILRGFHAGPRETLAYLVSAVVSIVMVRNLERHGRQPA